MTRAHTLTTCAILDRPTARRFALVATPEQPALQAISGLNLVARCLGRRSMAIWGMF